MLLRVVGHAFERSKGCERGLRHRRAFAKAPWTWLLTRGALPGGTNQGSAFAGRASAHAKSEDLIHTYGRFARRSPTRHAAARTPRTTPGCICGHNSFGSARDCIMGRGLADETQSPARRSNDRRCRSPEFDAAAQLAPCSASLASLRIIGQPEAQLLRGGCERKEAQWCVGWWWMPGGWWWMPGGWWWIQATQAAAAAQEVAQPCVRRFDVSRGELQRQLGNIG
mgnify:CR=1 FL=1